MADLSVGQALHLWTGIVRIRLDDDSDYEDLGEYDVLGVTPAVTKLQYYTRKVAGRSLAKEKVSRTEANFAMTLNSLTARNLGIALGGVVSNVAAGHDRVTFLEQKTREADFRFEGKADADSDQIIDFTCRVSFTPEQQFALTGDDWAAMSVTGQVLVNDDGHFGWFDVRDQGVAYDPPPAGSA
jgi:hypothetical protein